MTALSRPAASSAPSSPARSPAVRWPVKSTQRHSGSPARSGASQGGSAGCRVPLGRQVRALGPECAASRSRSCGVGQVKAGPLGRDSGPGRAGRRGGPRSTPSRPSSDLSPSPASASASRSSGPMAGCAAHVQLAEQLAGALRVCDPGAPGLGQSDGGWRPASAARSAAWSASSSAAAPQLLGVGFRPQTCCSASASRRASARRRWARRQPVARRSGGRGRGQLAARRPGRRGRPPPGRAPGRSTGCGSPSRLSRSSTARRRRPCSSR